MELESFFFGVSGSREAVSATVKDALMGLLEAQEKVLTQTAARGPEMMPLYRPETGFQSHDQGQQKSPTKNIKEERGRTLFELIHGRLPTAAEVQEAERARTLRRLRRMQRKFQTASFKNFLIW